MSEYSDGKLIYEYIIGKYEVAELKRRGLTDNGIIGFADNIMERYFNTEYLEEDKIEEFNEEN